MESSSRVNRFHYTLQSVKGGGNLPSPLAQSGHEFWIKKTTGTVILFLIIFNHIVENMDLIDLRLQGLGINAQVLGRIFTFVDFGNVNKWFEHDVWKTDGSLLSGNERLIVDIVKMAEFIEYFSPKKFFYYGIDPKMPASLHLKIKAEKANFRTISKQIQWIKHYLPIEEQEAYQTVYKKGVQKDEKGIYFFIPKCNFDVEICLDAMRLIDQYDTICLFSSDSDFQILLRYLKQRGKKVILVKGGHITSQLRSCADILINVQQIKPELVSVKTREDTRKQKGLYLSRTQKSDPSPRAGQAKLAQQL